MRMNKNYVFRLLRTAILVSTAFASLWLIKDTLVQEVVIETPRALQALTDLSNLDADGYFQGEDLMPNTTPKPDVKLIFYNRVPKCGSRSVMSVIDKMGQQNGFKWISSDIFNQAHLDPPRRAQFVSDFMELKEPYLYDRHIFFINFTEYGFPLPTYINLIRDPFERLLSFHCYVRDEHPLPMADKRRKSFNSTYEECVRQNMSICTADKVLLNLLAYFCGQEDICLENAAVSLARAKRNVIEHYSVIGIMEDLEGFFYTLEKMFPGFFKGARDVYLEGERGLKNKYKNSGKEYPPKWVVDTMKTRLGPSYEFYRFIIQRQQNLINYFKRKDAEEAAAAAKSTGS